MVADASISYIKHPLRRECNSGGVISVRSHCRWVYTYGQTSDAFVNSMIEMNEKAIFQQQVRGMMGLSVMRGVHDNSLLMRQEKSGSEPLSS